MTSPAVLAADKPRERLLYLDLLRCLSIFAATVLHATPSLLESNDRSVFLPGLVYVSLCVFCVPVLLMISGALMLTDARHVNIAAFYRKRLPKILVPLVAWSVLYYIIYCISGSGAFNAIMFLERFFGGAWSGPLWFLHMMAALYLMVPFVRPVFGGETKKPSLIFAGIIFGAQALQISIHLTLGSDLNPFFMGTLFPFFIAFFVLGNVLCRTRRMPPGKRGVLIVLFCISAAAVSFGEIAAKTGGSIPQSTFYTYSDPLVVLMGVCVFLFFKDWNPSRQSKRARLISWLSPLSYGIFLSHMLVQKIILIGLIPLFFRPGSGVVWLTANPLVGPLVFGVVTFTGAAFLTAAIQRVPGLRRIIP